MHRENLTIYRTDKLWVDAELVFDNRDRQHLFLHLKQIAPWSLSVYKECLYAISMIKAAALDAEFKEIKVLIPGNDVKLLKFENMMGFEFENGLIVDGKEYIILRQETMRGT